MDKLNLFLIDMSSAGATSGVDRYLNVLMEGLSKVCWINVHRIQLVEGGMLVFPRREIKENGIQNITLPLPKRMHEILSKEYWTEKYNAQVFRLIEQDLSEKENCVLHLHTLNLIDLALYIKARMPCKIITHMHCIPWKALYNHDVKKFNVLYHQIYNKRETKIEANDFLRLINEWDAYHKADRVICVTNCAKDFLRRVMKKIGGVSIIPNGIKDDATSDETEIVRSEQNTINLLYVGVVSASKGLSYILEVMRKVQSKGYKIQITAAGRVSQTVKHQLEHKYSDVSVNFAGLLDYEKLCKLYKESDIGVIASLQEQSSYVAIEMMMHSLPVITTAVDGLNEMFEDGKSALKVHTKFSPILGLSVNTDEMAKQMIRMIESKELRRHISNGSRARYNEKFTLDRMINETTKVYRQCIGMSNL